MDKQEHEQHKKRAGWITVFNTMREDSGVLCRRYTNLSITQARMLIHVCARPDGMRVGEISQRLHLRASTTTAAINRLTDMGLLERSLKDNDRRAIIVKATDAAAPMLDKLNLASRHYIDTLRERFSRDEILTIASAFLGTKLTLDDVEPYENIPAPLNVNAVYLDSIANMLIDFNKAGYPYKLSFVEANVLRYLVFIEAPVHLSVLSERLQHRPNIITVAVNRLESRGMVRRERDEKDRRAVNLYPTEEGADAVMDMHEPAVVVAVQHFGYDVPAPQPAFMAHDQSLSFVDLYEQ